MGWRQWQQTLLPLDEPADAGPLNRYRISTAVLATHRDPASRAIIASLSIPWGSSKGNDDLGGNHLVWRRDLVQIAGGLLAAGNPSHARAVLDYLVAVQEADGHWLQNSWLDGRLYWQGVQMDETAFPVLLYDMLLRAGAIDHAEASRYGAMIEAAAGYIVCNGPAAEQDRWEEDGGYSPFTAHDSMTQATGLRTYICDLPNGELRAGASVQFTSAIGSGNQAAHTGISRAIYAEPSARRPASSSRSPIDRLSSSAFASRISMKSNPSVNDA